MGRDEICVKGKSFIFVHVCSSPRKISRFVEDGVNARRLESYRSSETAEPAPDNRRPLRILGCLSHGGRLEPSFENVRFSSLENNE